MKKSSLITVALASLVGLVGCNQQAGAPSKTVSEKTIGTFIEAFFSENYYHDDDGYLTNDKGFRVKDEDGNYIKIQAKKGEVTEDTFDATNIFLNPEKSEIMTYYQIPESTDSFAAILGYYSGITEEDLAGYGTDGNSIVDIALYNTAVAGVNLLFGEEGDAAEKVFGFKDFAYVSDDVIELKDVDEDGINDYGYSAWINYDFDDENFDPETGVEIELEFVSYIYKFEGSSTYDSLLQVNCYAKADF